MPGKPDKKKGSPKAKQSGNGNNRNQSNQRRHSTRSSKPELMQQSDSGRKAVPNTFASAKDRNAMTKTKTPFQSPTGQQVPRTEGATNSSRPTSKKGSDGTTAVDHGVNSSQQQNRVPYTEIRDSTTASETEDATRITKNIVQTQSHESMTAQKSGVVTYDSETAHMYFAPEDFTRSNNDDIQFVSDAEAAQQAEINATLND